MSVLIEAWCLVVKHLSVALSFSNGLEGFTESVEALGLARYIVTDGELIAVSVYDPSHLEPVLRQMVNAGLVTTQEDGSGDFVFVDMELGDFVPRCWLTTEDHQHGVCLARLVGGQATAFACPPGWVPQDTWTLRRYDLRDVGAERAMLLGTDEAGNVAVLDFQSGRVVSGTPERSPIALVGHGDCYDGPFLRDPRLGGVRQLLRERGGSYRVDSRNESISLLLSLDDESPSATAIDKLTDSLFIDEDANTTPADSEAHYVGEDLEEEIADAPALLLPDAKCMMLISVTAAHNDDALEYRAVLPRRLSKGNRNRGAVLDQIRSDAAHCTGAVLDVDEVTGTMSLMLTVHREADETWQRTAERGFTTASAAGSRVTRSTEPWC
jgi:hypothetical protein